MASEHLHIASDKAQSAKDCAAFVLAALKQTIGAAPFATLAISGGSTPKLLFEEFARAEFNWHQLHLFWVDERCVPPSDEQSNFKLANDHWLAAARFPASNIHRIRGELTPDEAAIEYIADVRRLFGIDGNGLPAFDVIHRGMGPDAHTASLFPGEPLIDNDSGVAAAVWVEKMKSHRVTLLPGVLKDAKITVLQIAGDDKAAPLHDVLRGDLNPKRFPCQIATRDSDRAHWFLDRAAAARVSQS